MRTELKAPLLGGLLGAVVLLYPVFVYLMLDDFGPRLSAITLSAVFLLRAFTLRSVSHAAALLSLLGFAVCTAAFLLSDTRFVLLLPALINGALGVIFASSVVSPPTVAEQVAMRIEKNLPPETPAYCRKVTLVWIGFFAVNGLIACATALFAPLWVWTLYNGGISYVLIGALFAAELLYRRRFKRRLNCATAGTMAP